MRFLGAILASLTRSQQQAHASIEASCYTMTWALFVQFISNAANLNETTTVTKEVVLQEEEDTNKMLTKCVNFHLKTHASNLQAEQLTHMAVILWCVTNLNGSQQLTAVGAHRSAPPC